MYLRGFKYGQPSQEVSRAKFQAIIRNIDRSILVKIAQFWKMDGDCGRRRCRRVGRGLLLGKACTRGHEGEDEGTGEECPKDLADMLGTAHPRLVDEPAFMDRTCIDYRMSLAN